MTGRWHIEECGMLTRISARDCLRGGRRADLAAQTEWPMTCAPAHPARFRRALAEQVRQDLWRLLRRIRGFLPVVEVETAGGSVRLSAGGVVAAGRAPQGAEAEVARLLADVAHRQRWMARALRIGGRAT